MVPSEDQTVQPTIIRAWKRWWRGHLYNAQYVNGRLQIINYTRICNWQSVFVSNDYTVSIGLQWDNIIQILCVKNTINRNITALYLFNWRVLQVSSAPIIHTTGKGTQIMEKISTYCVKSCQITLIILKMLHI